MFEMLQLYAKYNQKTNHTLSNLIQSLPDEEIYKERTTYFESINGLVMHLIYSARYMMGLIRKHWNHPLMIHDVTAPEFEVNPQNPAEVFELLTELDQIMVDFLAGVTEEELQMPTQQVMVLRTKEVPLSIWNILMQFVVHQTHHRGQISQLLDELGVDHDYGNVWPLYL